MTDLQFVNRLLKKRLSLQLRFLNVPSSSTGLKSVGLSYLHCNTKCTSLTSWDPCSGILRTCSQQLSNLHYKYDQAESILIQSGCLNIMIEYS